MSKIAERFKKNPIQSIVLSIVAFIVLFTIYFISQIIIPSKDKEYVVVPDLFEERVESANVNGKLKQNHLKRGKTIGVFNKNIEKGHIISSNPPFKRRVKANSKIDIYYSLGVSDKVHEIPYVLGMTVNDGINLLKQNDIKEENIEVRYAPNTNENNGRITSTIPSYNQEIQENDKVILMVSNQSDDGNYSTMKPVPNILGMHLKDAIDLLTSRGFKFKLINGRLSSSYDRIVIVQDPSEGSVINRTTTTINISVQ